MAGQRRLTGEVARKLRVSLTLTWAGLLAERLVRAFWPLWTLLAAVATALMLGFQDWAVFELVIGALGAAALGGAALLIVGLGRFRWPHRGEALARMDAALPGRPLAALGDVQAVGQGDPGSEALWQAHRTRMEAAAARARARAPDLRISRLDPFGLRYIALLGLVTALMFGSVWRVSSALTLVPGGASAVVAGPTWEGWIEPPVHTGLPSLYLADQTGRIDVPVDSRVTLRFYGEVGALALSETVSGRTTDIGAATDQAQRFEVAQDGRLTIEGPGGQSWDIRATPDAPPTARLLTEGAKTTFDGQMSQPFEASDDYGVTGGTARFALDMDAVDHRYGLSVEPEAREDIVLDLPLPISGGRNDFTETLVENLSQHPWAHLPVTLTITARDAAGQTGASAPMKMTLPARRFFDPLAAAIIEQRRDLLWSRDNARRVAQVIRAITYQPEDTLFRDGSDYLKLRTILRRLEGVLENGGLEAEKRDELTQAMWDLAVGLEDGDIEDALERMREAQERLSEAMRNGASDDEVARLMQEMRDATEDYLRQKSQAAEREDGSDQPDSGERNTATLDNQDLQEMMDHIQELMKDGRMAEAEEALRQFQQMMENMQVAEGQSGSGSPGQKAMEGLADTLRRQKGLSDQAFRDLQQRGSPGAQRGEGERGQGEADGGGAGGDTPGSLAERQQALRDELDRQQDALPGQGSEAGKRARDGLGRAGKAMNGAERALRRGDLAEALDHQSDAMDALREGMRGLGDALAEDNGRRQAGQGQTGGAQGGPQSDPLGRRAGQGDRAGTDGDLLQGEDVYRRARELLDELRRRSGESARSEVERDYLERLLERF